jgi:hypothetical protein
MSEPFYGAPKHAHDSSAVGVENARKNFIHNVHNCFCISRLIEWKADPAHKGYAEAIEKRLDLLMAMDYRAAHRSACSPQELEELENFERQRRPEFQAARNEKIRAAAAARVERAWEADRAQKGR